MAPTILIIGATGNTGQGVVQTLPQLLKSSTTKYQILGLTRSLDNLVSQKLAKLENFEMMEKDWTLIDAAWLKKPGLHLAFLEAGVKYVVRVSTFPEYIRPTSHVYYGRAHWAIENMLSQPEFAAPQFTSLQANAFADMFLAQAASWIKGYRKTGRQETLRITPAADLSMAMINPRDVGKVGAHILALEDLSAHNQARYTLSGPEDVDGNRIVEMVEELSGVTVENVEFTSTGWIDDLAGVYSEKVLPLIHAGIKILMSGRACLAETPTSKEILELAPPKLRVSDAFKAMVEE